MIYWFPVRERHGSRPVWSLWMVCVILYTAKPMAFVRSLLSASATATVSGWAGLGLVERTPCLCWLVWPMMVSSLSGKCLETLC